MQSVLSSFCFPQLAGQHWVEGNSTVRFYTKFQTSQSRLQMRPTPHPPYFFMAFFIAGAASAAAAAFFFMAFIAFIAFMAFMTFIAFIGAILEKDMGKPKGKWERRLLFECLNQVGVIDPAIGTCSGCCCGCCWCHLLWLMMFTMKQVEATDGR